MGAGVGVVAHADVLQAEFIPILAAIIGGTVVTLLATITSLVLVRSWARRRRQAGAGSLGEADLRA